MGVLYYANMEGFCTNVVACSYAIIPVIED